MKEFITNEPLSVSIGLKPENSIEWFKSLEKNIVSTFFYKKFRIN